MSTKSIFTLVAAVAVACLFLAPGLAQGQGMMPHAIIGIVSDSAGNAAADATVTLRNLRTGDTVTDATDANGQYTVDLNSMASGFQSGDVIAVRAVHGNLEGDSTVTVSSSAFDRCDVVVSEAPDKTPFLSAVAVMAVIFAASALAAWASRRRK